MQIRYSAEYYKVKLEDLPGLQIRASMGAIYFPAPNTNQPTNLIDLQNLVEAKFLVCHLANIW
ncbi:MAG: hypothetical protein A2309_03205 [Bacteroidetes bacterium RIFOXYB2_FULL_35_7]|nr:MAG: hypothetical protein A2309_03205 [Bacteroidetes bacterium RIFOXYB2_FULL_35_7]